MWHNVKEVLPSIGQQVLVKTKSGKITLSKRVHYFYIDTHQEDRWKGSKTFSNSIVSWCKIP